MQFLYGVIVVVLLGTFWYAGYTSAHNTVLIESKRLGKFYVGKNIIIVKEIVEYEE